MKSKKSIARPLLLGAAFCILYVALAVRPLGKEYQLVPEWTLKTNTQALSSAPANRALHFRLGQTMGYFSDDGRLLSISTFPFKAAISRQYYCAYGADNSSVEFFRADGTPAGVIDESGFPFFDEERIFVFLPGGSSFVQCNEDGSRRWIYEGVVPITAFSSSAGGCVAGFADGTIRAFSADGDIGQNFAPGGSDWPVILGAAISNDGTMVASVSGQERQRFVLSRRETAQSRIIFHEFLDSKSPRQRLVRFSSDDGIVWYNYEGGIGIVNIAARVSSHVNIDGQALSLEEVGDLVFVLTKSAERYTVYIIEKPDIMSGSFSFEAASAFIRSDGQNLYIGRDSEISRISVERN